MRSRPAAKWSVVAIAVALIAASCSSTSSGTESGSGDGEVPQSRREAALDTQTSGTASSASQDVDAATSDSNTTEAQSARTESSRRSDAVGDCNSGAALPSGPSVQMQQVDVGGVSVELAKYPRPDYEGGPWTAWGQGIVLDDGRFVSGIGDHLGLDGNSYVYVYDPAVGQLVQVADVGASIGQSPGEWGEGKLHSQMVQVRCGEVLFATYWGRRTEGGAAYAGGHILALDTSTYTVESRGIPVPGFGIPSLASFDGLLYGEGTDPSQPRGTNRGVFFVYDPVAQETIYSQINPLHDRFRSVLIGDDGKAFIATSDEGLLEYTPGGSLEQSSTVLPSGWLRAVSPATSDGTVYGVTKEPTTFFARSSDGTVTQLGPARGYTTSLALSPAGDVLYIPDAHGGAWEHDASLYAFNPSTGTDEIVVSLNAVVEQRLGLTLGGTYSVTTNNDGSTIYVVFNAGSRDDPWGEMVLAIIRQ